MIYFLIRIEYNQTLQENRMLSILFYGRKSIFFSFSWSQYSVGEVLLIRLYW
jgi:hypothetical protein